MTSVQKESPFSAEKVITLMKDYEENKTRKKSLKYINLYMHIFIILTYPEIS